jgi:hypothetical protein
LLSYYVVSHRIERAVIKRARISGLADAASYPFSCVAKWSRTKGVCGLTAMARQLN